MIISSAFTLTLNYSKRDYIIMRNVFSYEICKKLFLSENNLSTSNINLNKSSNHKPGKFHKNNSFNNLNSATIYNSSSLTSISKKAISLDNMYSNSNALIDFDVYSPISPETNDATFYINDSQTSLVKSENTGKKNKECTNSNDNLNMNINYIKRRFESIITDTYSKITLLFVIFLLVLSVIVLYQIILMTINKELIDEQMITEYHAHKCPNNSIPIVVCFIEFFLLLYNITNFQKILNGKYIFMDSKIIYIISIVWIIVDPCLNILLYSLFQNNIEISHKIEFICTLTSYSIIFIVYFIFIIYIIKTNNGNNNFSYFLGVPTVKCVIHNSYSCSCPKRKSSYYNEDELQSIDEYINFYNHYFNKNEILNNIPKILLLKLKFKKRSQQNNIVDHNRSYQKFI